MKSLSFDDEARATAVKELLEETGVELSEASVASMFELPVGEGHWWGEEFHRNYCVVLQDFPTVTGPEKTSRHEVVRGGVAKIGQPAGDGYHSWVPLQHLLEQDDLLSKCRLPLTSLLEKLGMQAEQSG
mmetsp:Transcript_53477/g.115571  ORF Transcript_53477/g.115571 Transcript_53477/m.115571 type:complete len:129 (+) Transcript_53477:193-579(+)